MIYNIYNSAVVKQTPFMKGIMKGIVVVALTAFVCNCSSSGVDPAAYLRGSWIIDDSKTTPDWPTYYQFVVDPDDTYEITGFDLTVIEKGLMKDLTIDSYTYTISKQTENPSWIGETDFARWAVDGEGLTISFYADSSMSVWYATFVCTHS